MRNELWDGLSPVTNWQGYLLAVVFVLAIGLVDSLVNLIF